MSHSSLGQHSKTREKKAQHFAFAHFVFTNRRGGANWHGFVGGLFRNGRGRAKWHDFLRGPMNHSSAEPRAKAHSISPRERARVGPIAQPNRGPMSHNSFDQHRTARKKMKKCFREKSQSCLPSRLFVVREIHLASPRMNSGTL